MLDMHARGSPLRAVLALVSVLALMLLAKIGPPAMTPLEEVAVVQDHAAALTAPAQLVLSAIDFTGIDAEPSPADLAPPADRISALDADFTAPTVPVAWRSSVTRPAEGVDQTDARPPNRMRM